MNVHEHEPDEQSDNDGNDDLPDDIALLPRDCVLRRMIGSLDGLYDRVDACGHAAGHIPDAKPRDDLISDDLRRSDVGQYTFQTVPDFNADLALFYRDQQQNT